MSLAEYAAQHGLSRVGARPSLPTYLREVWRRRQFMHLLARYRLESKNKRNMLGMGWVVLRPMLNALVYGTVFGLIMGGSKPERYVEFLIVGVFFFEFFSSAFSSGASSITGSRALVQSLSFPRMTLTLARVVQELLEFVPTLVIMLVFVVAMGNTPEPHWLLMLPLLLLYTMFNAGLALITARLAVHFRDLTQLLPFITRLVFFTTGVFFSVEDRFAPHPTLLHVFDFQPIHEFLSLARGIMLDGPEYTVQTEYWLYAAVWSVVLLVVGVVFFWQAEERYGRDD